MEEDADLGVERRAARDHRLDPAAELAAIFGRSVRSRRKSIGLSQSGTAPA